MKKLLIILALTGSFFPANAQESGKSYNDGHGGKIFIPLGDKAFADEVISFSKGSPAPVIFSCNSGDAVGCPNYDGLSGGFVSLGCGGVLILKFNDNALVNVEGPDLFIFEMGKYVESTDLAISKDNINWLSIGEINGATAEVDIEKFTKYGDVFNFVRLTDLKKECKGNWPGADIDAVAAIGSGKRLLFTGNVLFNFNESVLKSGAKEKLEELVKEIQKEEITELIIQGYTDDLGTDDLNNKLSLARALSVKKFLRQKLTGPSYKIEAQGLGENNPLYSNDTKEGQEKNRRVEIILIPAKK